mgnify:CR=1 FL=1
MNAQRPSNTYGHLAVHYRNPQEGPLAARLLREIGFTECYSMPQPDGNMFYHFVIDEQANRGTDRIFYLLCMPDLLRKLRQSRNRLRNLGYYKEDPAELFRRHVWINPFWEDDVNEVVELMGDDRVLFGSDWPHIEGMPEPLDYVAEIAQFSPEAQRRILRDNTLALNELRPA